MQEWNEASLNGDGVAIGQDSVQGPRMIEAPERDTSNAEAFVLELSAATPFFEAYGSVTVHIGAKLQPFKVRTVPHDLLLRASHISKPKIPKVRDARTGVMDDDKDSFEYQQWEQNYAYLKVLLGLVDVLLKDRRGQVVWVSTDEHDDTATFTNTDMTDMVVKSRWTQKLRQATRALKDMKITIGHVNAIITAIDDLSRVEQTQQEEDAERLLGESSVD